MDCALQSYCIEPIIDNIVPSVVCTLESNMNQTNYLKEIRISSATVMPQLSPQVSGTSLPCSLILSMPSPEE